MIMSLFEEPSAYQPLAAKMRPRSIAEVMVLLDANFLNERVIEIAPYSP